MSAVEVFSFGAQQVRTVLVDGEPRFVAADVCAVLGHSNPTVAVGRLDEDERAKFNLGRQGEATVVNESGLYSLILGSRKPEAKAFKKWVTAEVLPSIRRTGSYGQPVLPQSYPDALRALAAKAEEAAELEAQVEVMTPKALFADSVAASKSTILVGELAKILRGNGVDIGQNRLFEVLRDEGYLIKRAGSDRNMPTQYAMELGLFEIKETAVTHSDGHVTISKTPKVTGKGQQYFVNRYTERAMA